MITEKRIREAEGRIARLFLDQCTHGAQTKALKVDGEAACGQFIGAKAKNLTQRGIHGSAAALYVLTETNSNAHQAILGLIRFLARILSLRGPGKAQADMFGTPFHHDAFNTIKLSEVLLAFQSVPTAVYPTDQLQKQIAERLQEGLRDGKAWGYYLDSDEDTDILPTAYAVLALSAYGMRLEGPVHYLLENLRTPDEHRRIGSDVTTRIVALFVLTFSKGVEHLIRHDDLRKIFRGIWRRLEPLMSDDIEQNLEYRRRDHNEYIRIPWQLYLLAIAAKLDPVWSFSSTAAQNRINSIVDDVLGQGFYYPHSGDRLSSRTNAILFDGLGRIRTEVRLGPIYRVVHSIDKFRLFLGSRVVTLPVGLVAAGLMMFSIWLWIRDPATSLAGLAPEFIGPAAASVFLMVIRKSR